MAKKVLVSPSTFKHRVLHNTLHCAIHCLLQVSMALQGLMGGMAGMGRQAVLVHRDHQVCKARQDLLAHRVLGA